MTVKQVFVLRSDSNFELSSPIFGKGSGGNSFHFLLNIYKFFFQEKKSLQDYTNILHPFSVTILYVYGVNV